jgi:D-alanyl-D-alanine carboxypeptidase/D-alanyl-D-alanine-endopeptidase (penicillin-binding protein 4)
VFRTARLVLLIAAAIAGVLPAQSLGRRVERVIDAKPLDRHFWGLAIADSTGKLLYGRNADRLFVPASSTKLIVSATAAALLPADFTVRTSVYGTGPIADGTLRGHLVLYGRGDPTMGERCFATDTARAGACARDAFEPLRALARQLHDQGIRLIQGDVVGDGSYFEPELLHPGWEHSDLAWWYAAPVSGLGLSDNSLEVRVAPEQNGGPARVTIAPWLDDLTLENRTRSGRVGDSSGFEVYREPGTNRFIAMGSVFLPQRQFVAVSDPNRYTAAAFRQVLAEAGIAVAGATRSTTDSLLFQAARATTPLAEVTSRPLSDWLFPILDSSQNWYAEMLLKQLGRQFGQAGSWREGLRVERRFLIDSVGVDSTQFSLSDGSGLSTNNLVTPLTFVRLLAWMRRHPRFAAWTAGFPVSGRSGTLRNRLVGSPMEGRVTAKTGTISSVNTLSGYLVHPNGKTLIFSMQANNHAVGSRTMVAAIDSVLVAIGAGRRLP